MIQITDAGDNYFTRSQVNVIMNHSHVPSNGNCPYIGVLQKKNLDNGGINCFYLTKGNQALQEFLLE